MSRFSLTAVALGFLAGAMPIGAAAQVGSDLRAALDRGWQIVSITQAEETTCQTGPNKEAQSCIVLTTFVQGRDENGEVRLLRCRTVSSILAPDSDEKPLIVFEACSLVL